MEYFYYIPIYQTLLDKRTEIMTKNKEQMEQFLEFHRHKIQEKHPLDIAARRKKNLLKMLLGQDSLANSSSCTPRTPASSQNAVNQSSNSIHMQPIRKKAWEFLNTIPSLQLHVRYKKKRQQFRQRLWHRIDQLKFFNFKPSNGGGSGPGNFTPTQK